MGRNVALACGALVLALALLVLGPDRVVVCDSGNVLDRVAQQVAQRFGGGHIDGPGASYCSVPAGVSWAAAGAVLVAGIVIAARLRGPGTDGA